jgi:predicted DCC family thiol-disulfide oxidoreductase YuxK
MPPFSEPVSEPVFEPVSEPVSEPVLENGHLVLFDGMCHLCSASVRFIVRRDRAGRFRFAPLQSDLGRTLCREAGLDADALHALVLLTDGRVLRGADAALEIARHLAGPWRLLRVFKLLPRRLRQWLYDFVARRRYAWFGRRDACMVPSPELRDRFVA